MQKKSIIRTTSLLAALSVMTLAGCGRNPGRGSGSEPRKSVSPDSIAAAEREERMPFEIKEGRRLYNHYCFECHGESGDGSGQYYGVSLTPQPANFTDRAFMKRLSDATMFTAIAEGSAAVGRSNMCPPWGKSFDREEIECLITYIRSFSLK